MTKRPEMFSQKPGQVRALYQIQKCHSSFSRPVNQHYVISSLQSKFNTKICSQIQCKKNKNKKYFYILNFIDQITRNYSASSFITFCCQLSCHRGAILNCKLFLKQIQTRFSFPPTLLRKERLVAGSDYSLLKLGADRPIFVIWYHTHVGVCSIDIQTDLPPNHQ